MATLPFPPRYSRNSDTFQVPGTPFDDRQGEAADAYNDILRQRVNADVASGRSRDPFYREGNPLVVEARANAPERGLSPGFARDELLKRSDAGEFAAPGAGDLGQFAGSFDPANVPMGSNRFSPADQAQMVARDIAIMQGTAIGPRDKRGIIANLMGDSDVGRYGVPGFGDLGQFAGGSGGGAMSGKPGFDELGNSVTAFANGGEAQAPAANPFADPNTMAVYDQMRQTVSPKEFGDEMLAGAAQTAPEDVAAFRSALEQIEMPPEALDLLNNMVDEILANPEQYEQIRAKYKEMGAPDEILPEQFDPQFFAALNMAVDQMIGAPAGVQAFAQGGIAELKPIAKAIASYGRNGDTMLAHITPAEARMLRRRGGSGTINPNTGLPEFFGLFKAIGKAFKAVGNAVKSFASSTVGKIITTVALGFFLGPAAAGLVGATSAAGVAAVSGFVGGAGSTLLGGGNLKDALKAGAIGGLTAGAVTGVTQGFGTAYTGPTTVGGQVDRFTGMLKTPPFPQYTAQGALTDNITTNATRDAYAGELYKTNPEAFYNPNAATPDALADFTPKKGSLIPDGQGGLKFPEGQTVGQTKLPGGQILTQNVPIEAPYDPATATRAVDYGYKPGGGVGSTPYKVPTIGESFSKMGEGLGMGDAPASFDTFKQGATDLFSPGPSSADVTARARQIMNTTPGTSLKDAMALASGDLGAPSFLRSYGPATLAGIGALGAAGGFKAAPAQPSAMRDQLMKPVTQRIAEGGNQRNYYIQGLPGVKYDQYGAPVFGQYDPLPTYDTGLGIASLAAPRGYAAGGEVTAANFDEQAYLIANPSVADELRTGKSVSGQPVLFTSAYDHYVKYGKAAGLAAFNKTETAAAAAVKDTATKAKQATARGTVAAAKAAKKAKGFTSAYENINAGLSFDAPEGYAANARATRQAAFAPTLNKFINAGAANTATLGKTYAPTVVDQPYNKSTGYANVFNPVATAVNYDTTPVTVKPGTYTPPVFAPYVPPAVVDNTAAALEAERVRLAAEEAERVRLAAIEAERVRLAAIAAADKARFQGQSTAVQNQQIKEYLTANPTATDQTLAKQMDYFGITAPQVAGVVGMQNLPGSSVQSIDARYKQAAAANAGNATAVTAQTAANAVTDQGIRDYFAKNAGLNDLAAAKYMDANQIDPAQLARAFAGTPGAIDASKVFERYQTATANPAFANQKLLNMGGIATLGTGGYPRKTGQINGPGTATSDSIPAMLSDGEFVMTAKAVRGAGKGDRRAGAKRMYALMNQLEKNAARG